jgi:hypothetical protein
MVHPGHQLPAFVDNGDTLAPGKDGGKKPGYLNVLPFFEKMGDTDRIIDDK